MGEMPGLEVDHFRVCGGCVGSVSAQLRASYKIGKKKKNLSPEHGIEPQTPNTNPKPQTPNPKPQTPNPKPQTNLHNAFCRQPKAVLLPIPATSAKLNTKTWC